MATATEYGLIAALIGVAIIGTVVLVGNGLEDTFEEARTEHAALEHAPVLDPYGGPTFATAQEGLDSGVCVLGGVERLPPPDTTGRWMCVSEDNPDDAVTAVAAPLAAP